MKRRDLGKRCLLFALLLLALAPVSNGAEPAAPARRKLILLAIEGGGAEELAQLQAAGELRGGGFARLAAMGRQAASVSFTGAQLPEIALVSLATGADPAGHGILSRRVHLPEQLLSEWTAAERMPIGRQTLWQAVRAGGRQVGVVRWPGADNSSISRRGNWGLLADAEPQYRPRALNLVRGNWRNEGYGVGPGPGLRWSLPPSVRSFSTALTTSLEYAEGETLYNMIYDVVAVDRSDDGVVNYDGLLLTSNVDPSKGYIGTLSPGDWLRIDLPQEATSTISGIRPSVWAHLIEIAPDLSWVRLYVSGAYASLTYPGSLLRQLERANLVSPGPPDTTALVRLSRAVPRATVETLAGQLLRSAEFVAGTVLAGKKLPWDLILARLQPFEEAVDVLSPDRDTARALRKASWIAADHALAQLLDQLDPAKQVLIVVSSQGFQEVTREIDLSEILRRSPEVARLLARHQQYGMVPIFRVVANDGSAFVYINEKGKSRDGFLTREEAAEAEKVLARALSAYRSPAGKGIDRVVRGEGLRKLGLAGPGAPAIAVLAKPGIRLLDHGRGAIVEYDPPTQWFAGGFSAETTRQGFYFEAGAGIDRKAKLGKVRIEELARRVAELLEIPAPNAVAPKN